MKFCEAMDVLKNGGKVTRQVWKGSLYFMMQGEDVITYQPRLLEYQYDEDIMISDGWLVDDQRNPNQMTFCEVIPYLEDGYRAWISDWKDSFIYLDKTTGKLVLHMMESFPFIPAFESFTASDWIEA